MKQLMEELEGIVGNLEEAVGAETKKLSKEIKALLKKKMGFLPSVRGGRYKIDVEAKRGDEIPQSIIDIAKKNSNSNMLPIITSRLISIGVEEWGKIIPIIKKLPDVKVVKSKRSKGVPTGEDLYKVLKSIVDEHQAEKIGKQTVDATSASMLVKIADNLKAGNRKKFLSLPIVKMVSLSRKLMKR